MSPAQYSSTCTLHQEAHLHTVPKAIPALHLLANCNEYSHTQPLIIINCCLGSVTQDKEKCNFVP